MTRTFKFKPGDVCIGQNFDFDETVRKFNGIECTILMPTYPESLEGTNRNWLYYKVEWVNGEQVMIFPAEPFLKLKRSPEQLGSCDEMQKICNFDIRKENV